jgi:monoamine oxidase
LDEDDSFPGAQRVFPGGYGQLAQRLAEGLPVRFNSPVSAISRRGERVVVEADGRQWTAGKVIVTVALGVLKSGAIRFDPPLPAGHTRAIDRLGFGRFEKLVLRFDTAFWDDADQIQVLGTPGAPFTGWYNLNRVTGSPALMALNGGAAAVAADMPVERQIAAAGAVLAGIYPGRFRRPVDAQASNWWTDEFSRGSYSFTAVGSSRQDRITLGEPIDGRLWLAGEAQHPSLHSTVHGAWLSGQAAAEQAVGG